MGIGLCYQKLGGVLCNLRKYAEANKNYEKALAITTDIGAREGEAAFYGIQGSILVSTGDVAKAKEYFERALLINQEIGCRAGEAEINLNLN